MRARYATTRTADVVRQYMHTLLAYPMVHFVNGDDAKFTGCVALCGHHVTSYVTTTIDWNLQDIKGPRCLGCARRHPTLPAPQVVAYDRKPYGSL